MLWPQKRAGLGSIYRTTQTSYLTIEKSYLPKLAFDALKAKGLGMTDDESALQLGPIPKGTPINLLANLDLEFSLSKLPDFASLALKLNNAMRDIREQKLDDAAAAARLKEVAPELLALSKCPDFVVNRGHYFGTAEFNKQDGLSKDETAFGREPELSDADKGALIAFLKPF